MQSKMSIKAMKEEVESKREAYMIKNTTRSIGRVRISTSEVKRDIQRTIEKIKKMIKTTMTISQRPQG